MTTEKTYILVEIIHKGLLKKTLARDLPGRLAQTAYDLIMARGSDCLDATAKMFEPTAKNLQNQIELR